MRKRKALLKRWLYFSSFPYGYEFLANRTVDLNDRLDEVINQSTNKFNIIKDNVRKKNLIFLKFLKIQINLIGKQIEEENEKAANFLERKNHYIKVLEQKIDERFNQEAQIREEIGNKLFTIIDDKFNALKNEISKESGNRFECIENLKSYLENDVPKLNEMLNNEKIKREEGDDAIDKKITDEITQVQEVITTDKKNREQTEEAILEMLRVLVTKSKADIEAEREEREKTEETLISLLEDTCSNLSQQEQGII